MDTNILMQKVLDRAIQGKLVPQNPKDESASVLLGRIREAKAQMVKDGLLKKKDIQNDTVIFVGEDGQHYEKFTDGTVKCIEKEIPFDIPENWGWTRLSAICTKLVDGAHNPPKGESTETPYIMISSTNINNDTLVDLSKVRYLSEYSFMKENERTKASKGDIFLTTVASLGRSCVYTGGKNICFQRSVSVLTTLICNYYLKFYFDGSYIQQKMFDEANGTAQKGFYLNKLAKVLVPIPPLEEQKVIADKVKGLGQSILLIKNDERIIKELSSLTKSKVLDLAIRGQLVLQDPTDEPASVLLEHIREEKAQMVKDGLLKKKDIQNDTVIFVDKDGQHCEKFSDGTIKCIEKEIPFDVPAGWEWARLSTISNYVGKKEKINSKYASKKLWELELEDIEKGGRIIVKKTVGERASVGDKTIFHAGDILYSKLRPYLLKILVVPDDGICSSEIVPFSVYGGISAEYIAYYLKSPSIDSFVNSVTYGIKMPRVGTEQMANMLVSIPPLSEQKRIVSKIEKILSAIEEF